MRKGSLVVCGIIALGVIAACGVRFGWFVTRPLDYPRAVTALETLMQRVSWSDASTTRTAAVSPATPLDPKDALPDIAKFELVVDPPVQTGDVVVEIFASVEKSGKGFEGWMTEVANNFNRSTIRLQNGSAAKVKLRAIASGEGYRFIATQKYVPDAYTPSHGLWMRMLAAQGIALTPITERLLGNTGGIVMKERVLKTLQAKYSTVGVRQVLDAVSQGTIAMGYTDPFVSSTGFNFLVTVLATFAEGNSTAMLREDVVSAFEAFQRGVPFVALTTPQMRDSVQRDGSLDVFVLDRAVFAKAPLFQSGYTFIPFGVRHDSPLYGIGALSKDKREVLQRFAAFAAQPAAQQLATEYGFNQLPDYTPAFSEPPGDILIEAQKVWKHKKDAGRPVVAVFVGDVSGSMEGVPLRNLKRALLGGSQFISGDNSIGLVVFNDQVRQLLPISKFTAHQRAKFTAAVQGMTAGGQTAMYSGIVVALNMLVAEKAKNPECKPLLIVLTDGQTNAGLSWQDVRAMIAGLKVPIYTIGYNAKLDILQQVSSINEAASLSADEGDIIYKIGALLNAEM